jgi:hypothetical protein
MVQFMITDHRAGDRPAAAGACWHGSGSRGRRLECRDHGRAGDRGGSRGRSRAWGAGIMVQFMIMEHRAGDRLAASRPPRAAG